MSLPRGIPKPANKSVATVQCGERMARSPKDSPPAMKKKLCRVVSRAVVGKDEADDRRPPFRTSKCRDVAGSPSILKKAASTRCPSRADAGRRVQFRDHVTVFLMTDGGDVFCSECRQLNGDLENCRLPPSPGGAPSYYRADGAGDPDGCEADYELFADAARGRVLRFVLPVGARCKPDDVVVKASVNGSRIRLIVSRSVTCPDQSIRIVQTNEKFNLPVRVDPYRVSARLDVKGCLTVEAPLLGKSRHEAPKPSGTLQDISNQASYDTLSWIPNEGQMMYLC